MDILSFALGMVAVVVITMMVVAVVALVKVIKTQRELKEFMVSVSHEFSYIADKTEKRSQDIQINISNEIGNLYRRIDDSESHDNRRMDDIVSQMDSRLDKLQDKLNKSLSVLTSKISDFFEIKEVDNNNNNKILLKD